MWKVELGRSFLRWRRRGWSGWRCRRRARWRGRTARCCLNFLERMRLIERHQISIETFGLVGWNNFPAWRRRVSALELQCVGRALATDRMFLVKKFVSRHG